MLPAPQPASAEVYCGLNPCTPSLNVPNASALFSPGADGVLRSVVFAPPFGGQIPIQGTTYAFANSAPPTAGAATLVSQQETPGLQQTNVSTLLSYYAMVVSNQPVDPTLKVRLVVSGDYTMIADSTLGQDGSSSVAAVSMAANPFKAGDLVPSTTRSWSAPA